MSVEQVSQGPSDRRSPRKNPHPVRMVPVEFVPEVEVKDEPPDDTVDPSDVEEGQQMDIEVTQEEDLIDGYSTTRGAKKSRPKTVRKTVEKSSGKSGGKSKTKLKPSKEACVSKGGKRKRGRIVSESEQTNKHEARKIEVGKKSGTRSLPTTPSRSMKSGGKIGDWGNNDSVMKAAFGRQKSAKSKTQTKSKVKKKSVLPENADAGEMISINISVDSEGPNMRNKDMPVTEAPGLVTSSPGRAGVRTLSHNLAIDDLFRLTAELTALNKDSEKLTTPLHNKDMRSRLKSPMKTPQKIARKSPFKTPQKSPFLSAIRGSPRLSAKKLQGRRTPSKTPSTQSQTKTPTKSPGRRNLLTTTPPKTPLKSPSPSQANMPQRTPTKGIMKTPGKSCDHQPGTSRTPGKSPWKVRFSLEENPTQSVDSPAFSVSSQEYGTSPESSPNKDSSSSESHMRLKEVRRSCRSSARIHTQEGPLKIEGTKTKTGKNAVKERAEKRKKISDSEEDFEEMQIQKRR